MARSDPYLFAEGLLSLAGRADPSFKELGAAAVLGEVFCGLAHFLNPDKS